MVLAADDSGVNGASASLRELQTRIDAGDAIDVASKTFDITVELNKTLARLGPGSTNEDYRRHGTRIYAFAAQVKANALLLELHANPSAKGARDVLREHLQTSIVDLGKVVDAARDKDMSERLAKIRACTTWTKSYTKRCAFPRRSYCSYDRHFTGFADDAGSGLSHEDGEMLYCHVDRMNYVRDTEDDFANEVLNPRYAFEAKMTDGWAAALAAMDNKPAPQSGKAISLDFGGAFGMGMGVTYLNSLSGWYGCPSGFEGAPLLGRDHIDWTATQCTRKQDLSNLSGEPTWDFGGFFGRFRPLMPSGLPCPEVAGFDPRGYTQIHGSPNVDEQLYFCSRRHVPGTSQPFLYGGAYSRGGVDGTRSWVNPATGLPTCPNGFTSAAVQGAYFGDARVMDHPVVMCFKRYAPFVAPE
jgi:hypothetical protein